MSIIRIDGNSYDIGEVLLERTGEIIYDPLIQGKALDFSEIDDAVATRYIYRLDIEVKNDNLLDYDNFYYDITSPISVRNVEVPFGQTTISFDAKIKSVKDELLKMNSGKSKWHKLSVIFSPIKPQRYS